MSRETTASLPTGFGRRDFLAAAGVALSGGLAGCSGVFAAEADQVNVAGSSTVFPVTEAIASAFSEEHPTVNISLSKTGTGGGFGNFFCAGRTDINNASRAVADAEVEQCGNNGITPIEFTVATDALTVVVNPDADWIDCLTVEELREIWRADGAERWSDINEDWPDEEFELYGAATTSGTFDYFNEAVIGEEENHRSDYHATERDRTIVQGVQGSEYAMGYFGFSYYSENPDSIKAISIDNGDGCVEPSIETAMSGEYTPLSRPLYIYVAKESLEKQAVRDFARFYMKQAATDLVSDVGYVPITEENRDENLEKLDAAIAEVTE
ncbi:PstS family phosphate ABC transporter substrate-binding protein [Haloterrigena sp. SYSU A558-1]|uniref:PstS family phosphate ABC transporter substrate-binding protein n=1 Tax=Haloterrigena gelatinilytica TaxID=2741724 RepID=A0A8J8GSL2_9EURY|nr:PstS family phosphate ABC transporter substrate-binding protein [Haloterrigena gelatinilytica]NUB92735.1 PstS family phosphate ABC transporter substrate-binding protein [Haloterrigena gelatinilytica]NUC71350.1 PstS family phosphate ABC transporter substrate-binding protein [Haloterrigena gelatinilytica]